MSFGRILALTAILSFGLEAGAVHAQYGSGSPLNWQSYGTNGYWGGSSGGYNGGLPGYGYNPGNMSLVVSQTQNTHDQIANLMDQLRRMQGTQVQITTPYHSINDSFYERIGVDFDFSFKGGGNVVGLDAHGNRTSDGRIHFNQGSFDSAMPQFGGHDPSTDATFGFGAAGGKFSPSFRFALGQGSNRSHVMQAPTVVMHDGQTGFFSDSSMRPFVTSVVPVVGTGMPMLPMLPQSPPISPVKQALARMEAEKKLGMQQTRREHRTRRETPDRQPQRAALDDDLALGNMPQQGDDPASTGDDAPLVLKGPSATDEANTANRDEVDAAETEHQQAQVDSERQQEILARIAKARGYEESGKLGIAKIYYQQAAARASGEMKKELLERIQSLGM